MMSILITGFNRNMGFAVGHAWKAESNFPQKVKEQNDTFNKILFIFNFIT